MSQVQHYLLRKQITLNKHANIFMTQHDIDESQLFKNRKIAPHHIVGKPEIIDKRLNLSQPLVEEIKPLIKIKPISYKEYRAKKFSQQQEPLEEIEFIQIDMEPSQVEMELQKLQQKKTSEITKTKKLSLADQAVEQKDERIMKQFEKQQSMWSRRTVLSAHICKRPISESIYNQIYADREKAEDRKLLDLIQTDAERHGNKLWERQLRSTSDVVETNQKILSKGLELIKRPESQDMYKRPNSMAQRFRERADMVNQLVANVQSVENLKVEGQNQLKNEIESVTKMIEEHKKQRQDFNLKSHLSVAQISHSKRKQIFPFKKVIPLEKNNNSVSDVNEVNYDRNLLRQQGKLDIYKQFF